MRKAKWIGLLVIFVLLLFSACSNTSQVSNTENVQTNENAQSTTQQDVIKLRVADSVPPTNFISTQGITYWMNRVKELTNNQVEFEYYPNEQLGKASSMLDLTRSKTVEIGYITYAMDKMPLSRVAELPGAFETAKQGSLAYWKLVNELLLEKEYLKNGVRPIWAVMLPQYQVLTRDKKIESMDDFKGLKIRTTGGALDLTINALGATPVSMPGPETYTALERGTVDGVVFPITSYEPYQLNKIAKYSTINAQMGSIVIVYAINEDVFQQLPDHVKEAMTQAGNETVEHFSSFLDQEIENLIEKFRGEGLEMYELSDDLLGEIDTIVQNVWDDWAAKNASSDLTGQEVMERYLEYLNVQ